MFDWKKGYSRGVKMTYLISIARFAVAGDLLSEVEVLPVERLARRTWSVESMGTLLKNGNC